MNGAPRQRSPKRIAFSSNLGGPHSTLLHQAFSLIMPVWLSNAIHRRDWEKLAGSTGLRMASFMARLVRRPPVTPQARKVAISVKTIFRRDSAFMMTTNKEKALKAIFFDAFGTLFYLTKTVGYHYALVGEEIGLKLDAQQLNRAFYAAWKKMPQRLAIDGPRENDDKGWWHELVDLVLDQVAPSLSELDRDNFFEIAYEHFAEAGVWELYPEVVEVLGKLRQHFQLAVISNFDGRLRFILEHLGISKFFSYVFISSETGADKPDPAIFQRALKFLDLKPNQVLHVGDDSERDWKAASEAGLSVFRLDRQKNSLRDLLVFVGC
jgi:putative hydrolase of the HAD superfamily